MLRSTVGLAAAFLAAAFALTPAPAAAYTPESGIWWNPNESGSGVVIEVQDNLMVVAAYVGDEDGNATWYTATAFLQGNALFQGSLDLTQNSQCIGCPYLGVPTVTPGAGGTVKIVFDATDETKAALTWANGRTIPIERFEFYTRRPEDGATPTDITKMLGEWQWVMDASSVNGFPFYGDVLVFDVFGFANARQLWIYEGCRAENSIDGGCSEDALDFNPAAGTYVQSANVQCIVVKDSSTSYVLYASRVGTNDVRGEATVYPRGTNPGTLLPYPTRAFRSASRTFVQEGTGPAKSAPTHNSLAALLPPSVERNDKALGDLSDACLPVRVALEDRVEGRF